MLGVAVVGLGVGEQHALAYQRSGQCVVRWLYDLNDAHLNDVAARVGSGRRASSFQEILADAAVDIVSIASFDDAHAVQVVQALSAGKHVFVEKPLCRSLDELRAVKRARDANPSRFVMSNLVLRAAPIYGWLRDMVQSGRFGEIYAFDGEYLYGRLHKITSGWRQTVENYSVMVGGGVHLVDLMLWITRAKPTTVTAAGNAICTAATAFQYDDYTTAIFRFPSGLIGRITANFGCVHPHQHVVRLFGTKATFIYDDRGPRLYEASEPACPPTPVELPALPATKGDLIPTFLASLANGQGPAEAVQHEFDLMAACLAADGAVTASEKKRIEYL